MDWPTLLAFGLLALAWLIILHQSWTQGWTGTRVGGMLVFLIGTTGWLLLAEFRPTGFIPLLEGQIIALGGMVAGVLIARIGKQNDPNHST